MRLLPKLKFLCIFPFSLLFGCATPNIEDVAVEAERYLNERFGRPYDILEAKSNYNGGNWNPNSVRIIAAPQQEPRELINFTADYIDGVLKPTGMNLEKRVAYASEKLRLSLELVHRLRPLFPHSQVAVLPNSMYEEKVAIEIKLYQLPSDDLQEAIFTAVASVLKDFVPTLGFETLNLEIKFLAPEAYQPREDGLVALWFEYNSLSKSQLRAHIYQVEFFDHPIASPPNAAELRDKLGVDHLSSTIQSARHKAQRWLEKQLKQQPVESIHIGLNRLSPTIVGPFDRIRFEFANCEIKRHPSKCPPEQKSLYRVIYQLNDHQIALEP